MCQKTLSLHWNGTIWVSTGGGGGVLLAVSAVARLESLEIPESCLKDKTNEVGEASKEVRRSRCGVKE
jgi:hypothetical protein